MWPTTWPNVSPHALETSAPRVHSHVIKTMNIILAPIGNHTEKRLLAHEIMRNALGFSAFGSRKRG